jgi:hypothetical protein
MGDGFLDGTLGATGLRVHRLGLAASYRPGERTVGRALDEGVDYVFCFGVDGQMVRVLRGLTPARRERIVIATGAYNCIWWRQDLEKTHVDVCLTAPRSEKELLENLAAAHLGPLPDDEMAFMRANGDAEHRAAGWFM